MQERERQRAITRGSGPGSDFFGDSEPAQGGETVLVSHGTFAEELPVGGMTVAQVRSRFRDRLAIHPQAIALLGGHAVDDDTIVGQGQVLTFVRPAGEKGQVLTFVRPAGEKGRA